MKKVAQKNLIKFFSPTSVAIIGASSHHQKVGHIVVESIIAGGYKGKIFLVNPHEKEIDGLRCYPDYTALPIAPDLAILAVPSDIVLTLLEPIAQKGTKNILIFSAGFKETGAEGKKLEDELITLAKKYTLNILGPNCLGFINNAVKLNATFGQGVKTNGNLRFISQSGAIATAFFDWADCAGVGCSEFITLGNKAILNENNILEFWLHNRGLKKIVNARKQEKEGLSRYQPVGLYLESISAGKEFLSLIREMSMYDPVFILKPGKSNAAKKAMQSHTGAIAGDDAVLDVALRSAGALRCEGMEDMFDLSRAFAWENAPNGPGVAIVSNAGGPAVISSDLIEDAGLTLATLSPHAEQKLAAVLPPASNFHNPVDVLGDALAERYAEAISIVLAQKEVHALIVLLTPQIMTQIAATAEAIGALSKKFGKPVLCSFMGGSLIAEGEAILSRYKIPSFRYPERAIKALGKMYSWQKWRQAQKKAIAPKYTPTFKSAIQSTNKICAEVRRSGRSALSSLEANTVLREWGIATPPAQSIISFSEAKQFVQLHKWPVVLKISASKLLHKTENHAIVTNITTEEQLSKEFARLSNTLKELGEGNIEIQKQIMGGVELIVGVKRDDTFGRVLLFGAGGVLAELIGDRNLAILPLNKKSVQALVESSRAYKLLNGFRGGPVYNLAKLYTIIEQLVTLAEQTDTFSEIEINPLIITPEAAYAVDGRAILI